MMFLAHRASSKEVRVWSEVATSENGSVLEAWAEGGQEWNIGFEHREAEL